MSCSLPGDIGQHLKYHQIRRKHSCFEGLALSVCLPASESLVDGVTTVDGTEALSIDVVIC